MIGINRTDAHQPLTNQKLPLTGHTSISQTFYSSENNLNIVSLCLRNPSRVLAPLEFSLHEATTSAKPIRTIPFSTGNIDNFDCTRFQFAPIGDSAGRSYAAQIRPLESEALYPLIGVYVEAHNGQDYQAGDAYLDQAKTGYDLHFKTSYYQSLPAVAQESAAQFFRRLGQDPLFFLLYALVIIYLFTRLFKRSHEK